MKELFKKARPIIIVSCCVFYGAMVIGIVLGETRTVNLDSVTNNSVGRLTQTLEYKVPVYGPLLQKYKDYGRQLNQKYMMSKSYWKLGLKIYINNFIITNFSYILRTIFILPVILLVYAYFGVGVSLGQHSIGVLPYMTRILEFGGYVFLIIGTIVTMLFSILPRRFELETRKGGFRAGFKLMMWMLLISSIVLLIATTLEVIWVKQLMSKIMG